MATVIVKLNDDGVIESSFADEEGIRVVILEPDISGSVNCVVDESDYLALQTSAEHKPKAVEKVLQALN